MRHRTGLALLLLAAASTARAAAPSTPGSLGVAAPDGSVVEMPLRHTRVDTEITAFVARTVVEQTFENPFDHPVEAVYTFPLGHRAAVDDYEFVVGDRVIRGEIRRREEARRAYEEAREAGLQAALLEQERPNVFTQSIANLEPGREIRVRIRTVEVLEYEAGVYRFLFPLVVGPRYVPGGAAPAGPVATGRAARTTRAPDADRVTPPVLAPGFRSRHDVEIRVRLDAGVAIASLSSPSHTVVVERPGVSSAVVTLAPSDTIPNKDFMLRWSVSSEKPAVAVLAHRAGTDGFFTLLVQPKGEVAAEEAAPKEIVFVLDTSGSMQGVPLDASKRLVKKALETLGPRDTFNLVRFAGDAEVFSSEPLPSDRASIARAVAWIDRLQGGGGTEMLAGFRAAFERPPDPRRLRMVVFLTDGFIGNDPEILGEVKRAVGDARVYTLGIGSSVNHFLLDGMASLGRGAYVYVRADEPADEAVDRFRSWVTRPYLTDLSIDWGALPVADVAPRELRDLGSGQTLQIVGRYLGRAEGEVVVRGKLAGIAWEKRLRVTLPEREDGHAALASVWARHRIEELLREEPGKAAPPSVEAEVTALALEFRLMSPFTSFVAVDDRRVVNPGGRPERIDQALPVPDGVSFASVFGADGPAALRTDTPSGPEAVEDHGEIEVIRTVVENEKKAEAAANARRSAKRDGGVEGGILGGVVGGVLGGVMPAAPSPVARPVAAQLASNSSVAAGSIEETEVLAEGDGNPDVGRLRDTAIAELPVQGRFYRHVLTLAAGVQEPGASPSPSGAVIYLRGLTGAGRAAEPVGASARILDAAIRLLADLSEDGKLSAAEGRPALAALLAAETRSGALAEDLVAQTFGAWALAEASRSLPGDPWVRKAARLALENLEARAPAADAETRLLARAVLSRAKPGAKLPPVERATRTSSAYAQLTGAAAPPVAAAPSPWCRLVRSLRASSRLAFRPA